MSPREQQESGAIEPRRRSQLARATTMPAFSPFSLIRRIAEDMDRMFEGFPFFDRLSPTAGMEGFTPIDILKQGRKTSGSSRPPRANSTRFFISM